MEDHKQGMEKHYYWHHLRI